MTPTLNSILAIVVYFCLFCVSPSHAQYNDEYELYSSDTLDVEKGIPSYSDGDVRTRINKLKLSIIDPQYTPVVRSYVRTYADQKRGKAESMLGKVGLYFPIFEKFLSENHLPDELKYLAITESALNPNAVSHSGAVGLWQFMPATGADMGLSIDGFVDERRDPYKSTKAAMTYLRQLHDKFDNWSLALAAYNSGPGRVAGAIKKARSTSFWKITRFLPKETRNYVPAFIAACYIVNHFDFHKLNPLNLSNDILQSEYTKVYESMTFADISGVTGVPEYIIETLNPSYMQRFIPKSYSGNFVTLPSKAMNLFKQFFGMQRPPDSSPIMGLSAVPIIAVTTPDLNKYMKSSYTVQSGDNMENLAALFHCQTYDLRSWNGLSANFVSLGQELTIYLPKNPVSLDVPNTTKVAQPHISVAAVIPQPAPEPRKTLQNFIAQSIGMKDHKETPSVNNTLAPTNAAAASATSALEMRYLLHPLKANETLQDILKQYEVSSEELHSLNDGMDLNNLKAGTVLKIKML
jgi:membrane-bound lytic murein transglycosylase D